MRTCPLCETAAEIVYLDTKFGHWAVRCLNDDCGVTVIEESVPHVGDEDPGQALALNKWNALLRERHRRVA